MKYRPMLIILLLLIVILHFQLDAIANYFRNKERMDISITIWEYGLLFNNQQSRYRLGMAYWIGDGVTVDHERSLALLEGLKLNGDQRPAYFAQADIYEKKGDVDKSLHYYKALCADEYEPACIRLGQRR